MTGGEIAGWVIFTILLLIVLAFLYWWFFLRRKPSRTVSNVKEYDAPMAENAGTFHFGGKSVVFAQNEVQVYQNKDASDKYWKEMEAAQQAQEEQLRQQHLKEYDFFDQDYPNL